MLVEYFERAQEHLYFSANGIRSYPVPTTILHGQDVLDLDGDGAVFRVLTPVGGSDLTDLDEVMEKWDCVAIQQLPFPGSVFVSSPGDIKWYADPLCTIPAESTQGFGDFILALSTKLEEYFCDPLMVKGIVYNGHIFVFEVGPSFCYTKADESVLHHYYKALQGKKLTVEDILYRWDRYSRLFEEMEVSKKIAEAVLDWLVMETGMGSFVGVLHGTNLPEQPAAQCMQPNARLYKIANLSDMPEFEPYCDRVAIVLAAEVVSTPRLGTVYTELERRISTWGILKKATIFLEGISSQEEFVAIAKKMQTELPVGIAVSTWGQLLRLDHCPVPSSHGTFIDIDSLVEDGVFYHLHSTLGVPDVVNPLLFSVLERNRMTRPISVFYSDRRSVAEQIAVCRWASYAYTTGPEFLRTIMCLAASKASKVGRLVDGE